MDIGAIIFDMDGLMIDSERLYFQAERDIAGKFGKEVRDETLWRMMGRKPIESLELFVRDLGLPVSAEEVFRMRTEVMREKLRTDMKARPGLFEIIGVFYGRLKLAVATGAQNEFMDLVVDLLGLREKFSVLQASDEVLNGKPDPEIYLLTCKKLGLEPKECAVLEDSGNGVLAAQKAGCYVIAVPSEYTKTNDFRPANFVATDLFDASRHIQNLVQT